MQVEIEYVREADHPGVGPCFEVARVVTYDDGRTERLLRIYPQWAVAARMAEYGCTQEQAVRILVAEPHLPRSNFVPSVIADPLWRRGAQRHIDAVERAMATLGFNPLDGRFEDQPRDPTALLRQVDVPAELVEELRFRHADVRASWREMATAGVGIPESSRPGIPEPLAVPTETAARLPG